MDDRVNAARRNFDHAAAAGEKAAQGAQVSYAGAMENASDLSRKLVEMAQANAEAALEATNQIVSAKTPADLARAWSTSATKQFAMFTDQAKELTGVWQKFFLSPG